MLRLVGFLVMAAVGAGGILVLDYNSARQAAAAAEDGQALTLGEYLGEIPDRIARATASVGGNGLPTALADMLPRAPEGWTVRPAGRGDVDAFLPKNGSSADQKARDLVAEVATSRVMRGAEVVVLTYEKDERRVMIQAIRYPDSIFVNENALAQRADLQFAAVDRGARPFLTARGLDVSEVFLGDGMRGRYFFATVGAQIHIRVVASKRMKDAELLPFFETLHVGAMNASVVNRQEGLGEVPVIVLASALRDADRAAYEADRAARLELALALADETRKAATALAVETAGATEGEAQAPTTGFAADCQKGAGGTKRCSVSDGN